MNRFILFLLITVIFKTEAQTSVLNVADSLYTTGNYSKAIEHYKTYDVQNDVFYKIAKAYNALGNYDEALSNFKQAVKASPDDVLIKYDYAKLLYRTKNYNESSEVFNMLIDTDSLNPNYHYELGLVYERKKDSTAKRLSRASFNKAFQLDNTHQKAIFKIAKYYLIKRKHDTVSYLVNIGLKSYPNNKALISVKAQNYYWKEQYHKANEWFEKLIALNESSQFIHEKLSFSYASVYNYRKAIEQQKLALKYDQKNATNLYILGQLYQKNNDYANAEKYIKMALMLQDVPLDAEYLKLGTIYNYQKKYKEAIEVLKIALKENPDNHMAQFFLVRSKDEYYKDYDAKIKLYENFKKNHPKNPFVKFSDRRLKELKEEQFLKEDEKQSLKETEN